MITQKQCAEILNKWPIDYTPRYRTFICGGCGKTIRKAWHIHCVIDGFKREFHLCRRCGLKYKLKV